MKKSYKITVRSNQNRKAYGKDGSDYYINDYSWTSKATHCFTSVFRVLRTVMRKKDKYFQYYKLKPGEIITITVQEDTAMGEER